MSGIISPKWANLDSDRREAFQRSITVANAGTTLIQNYVNKIIQQLTQREFGALGTLSRRPGQGSQAIINRRSGSAMTSASVWIADTATVSESSGAYTQETFTYQTLVTRGKVTRKMRARGRSYVDILAEEMTWKLDDFNNKLESALFLGDAGALATQIDGAFTLIGAVTSQVVANTSLAAGDSLTLAKLDETIDRVKGGGSRADLVIYASYSGARKLNAALSSRQRFDDMVEIAAGFRVRSYDGIPIVVSTGITDDMVWSGTAITAYTGAASAVATTALVVMNKRYSWMEELTPTTMMPLARDDSQFEQFDIFWDGALVYGNTLGGAILGGIAV